jgi:hypothetical protein
MSTCVVCNIKKWTTQGGVYRVCGSHCSNPVGWGTGGVSRGSNLDRGLRLRYNYNMDSNPAAHYQETVMKVRKHIRIRDYKRRAETLLFSGKGDSKEL